MKKLLILLAFSVLCLMAEIKVPALTGRVVDLGDFFSKSEEDRLTQHLVKYEEATGHQLAVLTIYSLNGIPLEEYSMAVVEDWQLGRAGADDGVLLLLVKKERRVRIEVGYGLEGMLSDLRCGRIIDKDIVPAFKREKYYHGMVNAINSIYSFTKKRIPVKRKARNILYLRHYHLVNWYLLAAVIIHVLICMVFRFLLVKDKLTHRKLLWLLMLVVLVWAFPLIVITKKTFVIFLITTAFTMLILGLVNFNVGSSTSIYSQGVKKYRGGGGRMVSSYGGFSGRGGGGFSSGGGGGFSGGGGGGFGGGGASGSW